MSIVFALSLILNNVQREVVVETYFVRGIFNIRRASSPFPVKKSSLGLKPFFFVVIFIMCFCYVFIFYYVYYYVFLLCFYSVSLLCLVFYFTMCFIIFYYVFIIIITITIIFVFGPPIQAHFRT